MRITIPLYLLSLCLVLPLVTSCEYLFGDGVEIDDDDLLGLDDDDSAVGCTDGDCVYVDPDYACQCADDCCEIGCMAELEGSCSTACGSGTECVVDCAGSDDCSVSCPDSAWCEVDCTETNTCAVNCPATGCVVHGCAFPMYCAVTCGDGGLPSQSGDDWICP